MNNQSGKLLSLSIATIIGIGILVPTQSHAFSVKIFGHKIIDTTGTITTGNGRVVDHRNTRPVPRSSNKITANGNRRNTKVIVRGHRTTRVTVRDHRTSKVTVRDHRRKGNVRDHR